MAVRKRIPKRIKELILMYGEAFKANNTCKDIIDYVEDYMNIPPRIKKTPKKGVDTPVKA